MSAGDAGSATTARALGFVWAKLNLRFFIRDKTRACNALSPLERASPTTKGIRIARARAKRSAVIHSDRSDIDQ